MDCVGCEKCRLWGKLQVQGLGTALKILFSVGNQDKEGDQTVSFLTVSFFLNIKHRWSDYIFFLVTFSLQLQLQRNEVIALVNLLNRLSESVKMVHEMGPDVERLMEDQIAKASTKPGRLRRVLDLAFSFWWNIHRLGIHAVNWMDSHHCNKIKEKVYHYTNSQKILIKQNKSRDSWGKSNLHIYIYIISSSWCPHKHKNRAYSLFLHIRLQDSVTFSPNLA